MLTPAIFAITILILIPAFVHCDFNLVVLHNNDMHGRFEETSRKSGTCKDSDRNKACIGGFARTAHEIRRFRKLAKDGQGPEVLFLNAGDTFVEPDAVCLGNHEFDSGTKNVAPFLNNLNCPVVGANLDFSLEPDITNVKKSVIVEKGGKKIGIIGYTTPETRLISSPGNTIFLDEVESVRNESERLNDQGIKIILALGHSGYKMDMKIAREVPLIDAVIGGHTNTFLWNGKQPDIETVEDPYPKVITQPSGKKVPVVQAYAYTKYLGVLNLNFDDNGDLIKFDGQPILLESDIPQEPDILDLLEIYRPEVIAINQQTVGQSKVVLEQSNCRTEECVFGNLVADAFAYYRKSVDPNGILPIGLQNGGGIRTTIEPGPNGDVTYGEILAALPFGNQVITFKLNGSDLIKTLEIGARSNGETSRGEFLQVSGIKYVLDNSKPPMSRVVSVKVRCEDCPTEIYEDVNHSKMYTIITTSFLTEGGDNHYILAEHGSEKIIEDLTDFNVLGWYFNKFSPVEPKLEGRITFNSGCNLAISIKSHVVIVPLIIFVFNLSSL